MTRPRRSTLRMRVIGIMSAVFVVVALSFLALLHSAMSRSFSELEKEYVRSAAVRTQTVLFSEVAALRPVAADWAQWTDTYEFVAGTNAGYPEENLSVDALDRLDVDFMFFVDESGGIVYSVHRAPVTGQASRPRLAAEEAVAALVGRFKRPEVGRTHGGFAALPGSSAAMVFAPITTSRGDARPNGTLVLGRYIQPHDAARFSTLAKADIDIARPIARASILPRRPHGDGEQAGRIYLDDSDTHTMVGWATVPGIDGRAAFVYTVSEPRTTMQRSSSMVVYVGVGLLVLTLVFGVALATTLELTVIQRLTRLHDELRSSHGGANGRRITVEGNDEITDLAEALNRNFDGLAEAEAALKHAADHDFLTGLISRRRLEEDMAAALAEAQRTGQTVAYLMFDLDGFKEINDTMGHHCGDRVLVWFAELLRSEVRSYSTIARPGGDEFAILMPRAGDYEAAVVADRIMTVLAETPCDVCEGEPFWVGASVGIAVSPRDGATMNDLCRAADSGMYATKDARARDCGER